MLQPEALLGSYRLIDRLGAGGMGEVWKAEDTRLGRTVAIKILPQAIANDATAIARMKREARTAAQLYHPNIATIHAIEEIGDRIFIVMELVDGEPLSVVIRRGPVPEGDVCRIGKSIADALAEAHEKGIVHRDIKPDNVIVNGPRVKVLDFGIAKFVDHETAGANDPTSVLTQQGAIIGTVIYMSPEQAMGKQLDARTDLFSLGTLLFEAATGRVPFRGETPTETLMHIARDDVPMPQQMSRGLAAIIHKCLRKNREERYASARELADALEAQMAVAPTAPLSAKRVAATAAPTVVTGPNVAAGFSPPARLKPGTTWVAVVVLILLAGALGAFVMSRMRRDDPPPAIAAPATAAAPPPETAAVSVTAPATIVEATTPPVVLSGEPPPPAAPAPVAPAPATSAAEGGGAPQNIPQRTADDDYNEGMTRLIERKPRLAIESFRAALAKDPHYAKAHFRIAELALFGRDFATARREIDAALADRDRLDAREQKLVELGAAVLNRDRERAEELLRELQASGVRDPDLMRFRELMNGNGQQRPPFRRPRPRP